MPVITQHRVEKFRSITAVRQPFWGSGAASPGGAQHALVQLFNPAGSGYRVYPEKMYVTMAGAGTRLISLVELDVATGVLQTTAQNKYRGAGAFSAHAQLYSATPALLPGTRVAQFYLTAGIASSVLNGHEARLQPGMGLAVFQESTGIDLTVMWEWKEIEIVT